MRTSLFEGRGQKISALITRGGAPVCFLSRPRLRLSTWSASVNDLCQSRLRIGRIIPNVVIVYYFSYIKSEGIARGYCLFILPCIRIEQFIIPNPEFLQMKEKLDFFLLATSFPNLNSSFYSTIQGVLVRTRKFGICQIIFMGSRKSEKSVSYDI